MDPVCPENNLDNISLTSGYFHSAIALPMEIESAPPRATPGLANYCRISLARVERSCAAER
ncbi:hypothetical protein HBI56_186390 [Parastagonospora nodorum]|uniref:Uncharacterized protein n=1 Tax=Phaeosphaeria nodorum (strain SN15 / ATCC MYA-4574 / FGSC 10173) TaxID=321614 RepID=A0A7U2NQ84_PHANO|nr:hypothetical protein HBH56_163200 [Parastagonospora nodorum]QRD06480.1 hypothetical protein JI435_307940 [Parastagonospora nodorum SN15]KAH3931954.1 hypothetical protein HBH54_086040 [Parastagonospora nodorum]KAH3947578.1 hypothetical protein HBH53_113320 [Parastagonospora nodorum]KAH3968973.1 hypothetical protein HBH52_176560 [Parastagonospora nodorum]